MSESTVSSGTPDTWAIVSLLGHKVHAGRMTEEEKLGVKMGRLDIPQPDGTYRTLYFGGASVYKIEVVSEAVARHVATERPDQPVSPWDFPKVLAAAPSILDDSRVMECGHTPEDCDCDPNEDDVPDERCSICHHDDCICDDEPEVLPAHPIDEHSNQLPF